MAVYKDTPNDLNLRKFSSIGKASNVVRRLELWITLKRILHLNTKRALHHFHYDIFLQLGIENLSSVYSH